MSRQIIVNEPRHRLWCAMRLGLGVNAFSDCVGTVAVEDEKGYVLACVVFNNFRRDTQTGVAVCHGSIAAISGSNWASKRFIKAFLVYAFEGLEVSALYALVGKTNKKSRKFTEKLGFKRMPGSLRRGLNGVNDAVIYSMLAHESAKWLGYEPNVWRERLEVANG